MRSTSVMCVLLMSTVATGLMRAQPEQQFRDAVDGLFQAGNYEWEEKHEFGSLSSGRRRPRSLAAGETMIGGYTRARFGKVQVAMYNREIAFALRDGWRHGDDLTVNDLAELNSPGSAASTLNQARQLPHELLKLLAQAARNFRTEKGAILAGIDPAILEPTQL